MLFHGFFNVLFSTHITDPTSMYKVFRADCLDGLQLRAAIASISISSSWESCSGGIHPLEVPVFYESRGFDEGKKIRILRDPVTWVLAILKTRFTPLRRGSDAERGIRAASERYSEKSRGPRIVIEHLHCIERVRRSSRDRSTTACSECPGSAVIDMAADRLGLEEYSELPRELAHMSSALGVALEQCGGLASSMAADRLRYRRYGLRIPTHKLARERIER